MQEKIILKYSPEVIVKSSFVRRDFSVMLLRNIKKFLKQRGWYDAISLFRHYDELQIIPKKDSNFIEIKFDMLEALSFTPGVSKVELHHIYPFCSFDDIFEKIAPTVSETLLNKRFRVRVKRVGNHSFTSMDVERFLGGRIHALAEKSSIDLKNFEEAVDIFIKHDEYSFIAWQKHGIEGFPLHSQDRMVSLISGGYDSGVSSYFLMRKGAPLDFLFFNLGGNSHHAGVKEVVEFLSNKYSIGYDPNFIVVDFIPVVRELLEKVTPRYRGILLKRCMMKVAERIAQDFRYASLVTGESLAQVSSQTFINLQVIHQALNNTPLLRPLLGLNKSEIVEYAREMGTSHFAAQMPEYCGVISQKPATKSTICDILEEEKNLSPNLIESVYQSRQVTKVSDLKPEGDFPVLETSFVGENEIILDIREEKIQEKNPLQFDSRKVECLPFYEVDDEFEFLDQEKTYLLYCDKGVMSVSHAQYLWKKGFRNIKIFRPHFVEVKK